MYAYGAVLAWGRRGCFVPGTVLFWSAVLFCSSFYFNWTTTGLKLAGQHDAALANSLASIAIICPSLIMLIRAVWGAGIFRR